MESVISKLQAKYRYTNKALSIVRFNLNGSMKQIGGIRQGLIGNPV